MTSSNVTRRGLLALGAAACLPSLAAGQTPDTEIVERVREVEAALAARRDQGLPVPAEWIAERVSAGLAATAARIAAFHVVQRIPYKLTGWTGDPDSLFSLGRGDCRHKSAALRRVMRRLGCEVTPVQVPFAWTDLPIPEDILALLSDGRAVHDANEVVIEGRSRMVDPTWDPPLGTVGFPVLASWDGTSATPMVTRRAEIVIRPGDVPEGRSIYDHLGIPWPVRTEVAAFNRAFNAWSDTVRTAS